MYLESICIRGICLDREAYNVTERTLDTVDLNILKVQPDVYTQFISDISIIYFGLNNNFQKIH
jgi:hypothetical protein